MTITAQQLHELGTEARSLFSADLFNGKVCLVTGASRGIGRATAVALGALGATVVVNYHRNQDAADAVVSAIDELDGKAVARQFDVADYTATQSVIRETAAKFGQIDVLVNNAGMGGLGPIVELGEKDIDSFLATNLKGLIACTQECVRIMAGTGGGSIVNVSSLAAFMGYPGQSFYSASKAGVLGLTRSLARELAPLSIRINSIAPGFIDTDMTAGVGEQLKAQIVATIPLQRPGAAKEIAWTAVFLASPMAAYITGETIVCDGGVLTR